MERDSDKVKIHYVGYSSQSDKYIESELEFLLPRDEDSTAATCYKPSTTYAPLASNSSIRNS